MKSTLIVLVLVLFSSTASAQDVCPEFANMVNVISADGATSKELGMEKAVAKQKKKGLYRGWDASIRLDRPTADVSVTASQSFSFKPMNANVHPKQQIRLYPFTTKKQYRELEVGGTRAMGGSKDKKSKDDSIELTLKKIRDGCYKVAPEAKLPKGQYAFSLGSSADVDGTNAGWGTSTAGQVWFGFSVK